MNPRPTLLADAAIPFLEALFGAHVRLVLRPAGAIDAAAARDADLLLVRTLTRVDEPLLAHSSVRFVGSPTAGTDHIDREWLDSRGIKFAHAPGANAEAVAQYLVAALLFLSRDLGRPLDGTTLGVVGRGHVGSRVLRHAHALGLETLVCDPPLERIGASGPFVDQATLLAHSDIVTLHVPLTTDGSDRTHHLIAEDQMAAMSDGTILINTSRGGVIEEASLREALHSGHLGGAVLDVFENEPEVDPATVDRMRLATPHVAGYTLEAKAAATWAVYRTAARRFGWPPPPPIESLLPPLAGPVHPVPPSDPDAALISTGLLEIARAFRAEPGAFARLRTDTPLRREIFRAAGPL